MAARAFADDIPPFLCIAGRVRLERNFVRHGKGISNFSFRNIFALDIELVAVNSADNTVGKEERELRLRVFLEVIVGLEFVQVLGRRDNVVVGIIAAQHLSSLLQGSSDQRLSGFMVLVGERDVAH